MPKLIIADTSCLILFHKIKALDILQRLYTEITITPEVFKEFSEELPLWIQVQNVNDLKYQHFLETLVDSGEASSIALAIENKNSLLLLDDLKARKLASKLNLTITGTLGVIHKEKGIIEKVKPLIEKIIETNFRISPIILDEFLKINNELN